MSFETSASIENAFQFSSAGFSFRLVVGRVRDLVR